MASVSAMSARALRPATAFARSGDVDAGRSCRGGTSDRSTMFARFSNVDPKSLGSRRALATGIDRDGLTSRSTRRGTTAVPRAAARDSAEEPSSAAPSHAPRASSPRELWELSGRSSAATHGVGVGASPSPPPMSPTLAAAVALLGGVAFAAVSRRAASRREELELQRRFRGELIRRLLKTAVGREWRGQSLRGANADSDERFRGTSVDEYREVDYAGDRLMSARDVAFARARGWSGRTKPSPGRKTRRFCAKPICETAATPPPPPRFRAATPSRAVSRIDALLARTTSDGNGNPNPRQRLMLLWFA